MCKKRKEKKLNMQERQYGVELFYYKYTHAIEKRRGWFIILPIPIAYTGFTLKKEKRGFGCHTRKKKGRARTWGRGRFCLFVWIHSQHKYVHATAEENWRHDLRGKEAKQGAATVHLVPTPSQVLVCFWIWISKQLSCWFILCLANFFLQLRVLWTCL